MKNFSVKFKQYKNDVGWISLFIISGLKKVEIRISYVFPPFDDIFNFLQYVLKGKHCKTEIDEEGRIKEFIAKEFDEDDNFSFIIKEGLGKKVFIKAKCNKINFVSEFINKLKLFLDEEFDQNKWNKYTKINQQKINKILKILKTKNFRK